MAGSEMWAGDPGQTALWCPHLAEPAAVITTAQGRVLVLETPEGKVERVHCYNHGWCHFYFLCADSGKSLNLSVPQCLLLVKCKLPEYITI